MSVIKRSLSFTSEPPRDAVNEELAQAQGGLSLDAPTISESSASEKIKLTLNQCIPDNVKLCFVVFVDFFFTIPYFIFQIVLEIAFSFNYFYNFCSIVILFYLLFYLLFCFVLFIFIFQGSHFFKKKIIIS